MSVPCIHLHPWRCQQAKLTFTVLDKFYDVLIWTSIEPCLGVVGCCIPTLGPLADLKQSAFYFKIKSIFSWQPLLGKSASETNSNRSGQRTV